jgi:hypothetical protein
MFESIIKYGIISIIVLFTLYFVNKGTRSRNAILLDGKVALKMNKIYLVIGIISCSLALLPWLSVFEEGTTNEEIETIIFLFLIFGIPGTFCILLWRNHFAKYDETTIEVSNLFGRINTIKWTEVEKTQYNSFFGYLNIKNSDGLSIKLHHHLLGIEAFLLKMKRITQHDMTIKKFP